MSTKALDLYHIATSKELQVISGIGPTTAEKLKNRSEKFDSWRSMFSSGIVGHLTFQNIWIHFHLKAKLSLDTESKDLSESFNNTTIKSAFRRWLSETMNPKQISEKEKHLENKKSKPPDIICLDSESENENPHFNTNDRISTFKSTKKNIASSRNKTSVSNIENDDDIAITRELSLEEILEAKMKKAQEAGEIIDVIDSDTENENEKMLDSDQNESDIEIISVISSSSSSTAINTSPSDSTDEDYTKLIKQRIERNRQEAHKRLAEYRKYQLKRIKTRGETRNSQLRSEDLITRKKRWIIESSSSESDLFDKNTNEYISSISSSSTFKNSTSLEASVTLSSNSSQEYLDNSQEISKKVRQRIARNRRTALRRLRRGTPKRDSR